MGTISFARNDYPTLGVELELQLVDAETFALSNSITDLLAGLSEEMQKSVKPELMQSYLEINTGVCRTVGDVRRDLTAKLKAVTEVTDKLGLKLFWAATHPFSSWRDQQITVNERYYELVDLMQDAVEQAGCSPDVIFVTGGTAKSPIVRKAIAEKLGDIPVVDGDHFGSVTAGLTQWAEKLYR